MTIFIMFLLLTTLLVRRNTSTRKADYIIPDCIDIQAQIEADTSTGCVYCYEPSLIGRNPEENKKDSLLSSRAPCTARLSEPYGEGFQ